MGAENHNIATTKNYIYVYLPKVNRYWSRCIAPPHCPGNVASLINGFQKATHRTGYGRSTTILALLPTIELAKQVTWSKAVEGNGTHIKTKNDVSVTKEVRMVEPIEDPNCVEGNRTHIKTKNDVSVTKELGTVEPIEDPSCLTLCGLRRLVARATPSPLVDPLLVKGHAWIPPLLDPNKNCNETCDLPLNGEEKKIWQKFKEFDKGTSEIINFKFIEEGKRSIELDHPIVSLIGNFAVVAFNEACEMHVKKDEHNNLHDFEVMECKYMKIAKAYYFYMTIEAIERRESWRLRD